MRWNLSPSTLNRPRTFSTPTPRPHQAYELDKQQRFAQARAEREAAEARKKHQEELKAAAAKLKEVCVYSILFIWNCIYIYVWVGVWVGGGLCGCVMSTRRSSRPRQRN